MAGKLMERKKQSGRLLDSPPTAYGGYATQFTNKSSEQMEEEIKQQGGKIDARRTAVDALQAKIQTLEEANEQRIEEELRCAQMRAAQATSSVDAKPPAN
ncbi:hypothetical protein FALBO_8102 [Fusarium albosuccineum]|uniref:Uncharacterized protein n=1 Tax=Fusarium albosuccineum TaxID=1237068 RepID=A0A8H4PBV4_9HYPO|nr:hypothetical protein FALBO_8102 [Fusarium albosuccineum]